MIENLKHGAFAIGDAKQWDRCLDKAMRGSDAFTNKNPSYQIFFYMLHSGLPWGILFVDYRDLAERHLGTIYEGLLEYTLHVATEPMVELKSSSKIVPAQGATYRQIVSALHP